MFSRSAGPISPLPTYRWQATKWPGEISVLAGASLLHRSQAEGHLVWKQQPEGGLIWLGNCDKLIVTEEAARKVEEVYA